MMPLLSRIALSVVIAFLAVCSTCRVSHAQQETLDGDQLFAPEHLLDVQITIAQEDWQSLRNQTRDPSVFFSGAPMENPYSYFRADMKIDGVEITSVGVRKKGFFGSTDVARPSLKIHFDKFVDQDPVQGLSRLTLNNNKQDPSLVSQSLSYALFRAAGIHAPRSNHARVTVNGEYLGIYSNVESVKKPFLKRSFGDKSGDLFEGTLTDFHPKTVDKLEAKTNEDDTDRAELIRLARLLAADGPLPLDELEQLIDVDNFMRYWAMEGMLRFWDGYSANQNNFFFYVNPENGLAYFIPWGADSLFTLGGGPMAFMNGPGPTSIYAQSLLANRLYHTDGIPQRYRKTMEALLDEVWNEKELFAEIDRVEALVADHLPESQRGAPKAMDDVREFIRTRRKVIQDELSAWPAEVPPEPRSPMYTVEVGTVSGSFSTVFTERPPGDVTGTGAAELKWMTGDVAIEFDRVGAAAQKFQMPRFGGFGGRGGGPFGNPPPRVSLTISGKRASDGEQLTLTMQVDENVFRKPQDDAITVNGSYTEGPPRGFGGFGGFGGGGPRLSVLGTLTLKESGVNPGDSVQGTLDLRIVEVHGGLFGQRRGGRGFGGRPPGGPGGRRPEAPRRPDPEPN